MLTRIRDEIERAIFERQFNQISEILKRQLSLPKESRVSNSVLAKLEYFQSFLAAEIQKYDYIEEQL